MTYNITLLSNATTPTQVVAGLNTISDGLYGTMTFLMIYIIILLTVEQEYMPNVMLGVSFLMSIIAGIMMTMNWLAWWVVAINFTVLAASIIWKIWAGRV